MGQAHSRLQKPIGLWHRHRPKAAKREPSQESFVQISPPLLKADHFRAQMDQSSVHADQSSTIANTTPASAPPYPDMHDTAMHDANMTETNGTICEAGNVDKLEQPVNGQHDQPTASQPDAPDKATQSSEEPTSCRPAFKREHTPPHRIHIWTVKAWETERAYATVHEKLTKTLNRVRRPPLASLTGSPSLA